MAKSALFFVPDPPQPSPTNPIPPDDDDLVRMLAALDSDGQMGSQIKDRFFGRSGR